MSLARVAEIVSENMFNNSDLFIFPSMPTTLCIAVLADISQYDSRGHLWAISPARKSASCSLYSAASKIQQYKAWAEIY